MHAIGTALLTVLVLWAVWLVLHLPPIKAPQPPPVVVAQPPPVVAAPDDYDVPLPSATEPAAPKVPRGWESIPNCPFDGVPAQEANPGDFCFYPKWDSLGRGVPYNLPANQLLSKCKQMPSCMGVSSSGELKLQINPRNQWVKSWLTDTQNSKGLWVKHVIDGKVNKIPESRNCVAGPLDLGDEYCFYQNTYAPPNDQETLTTMSPFAYTTAQMQQACSADPACVAFTTKGHLRRRLPTPSQWTKESPVAGQTAADFLESGMYVKANYEP